MRRKIIYWLICMILIGHADQSFSQIHNDPTAQRVFDRLVKTINQNSIPKPQLHIIPDPDMVAETFPNGEIIVGQKLINHCRTFGKDSLNAIAHIFSHELTHYYQNHFWAEDFGTSYASSNWGKLIENSASSLLLVKMYETQADQYGMYYALSAGYNTLDIGERVLDSVYKWYRLPDQLRGYPTRNERRNIAELSKGHIANLIPAFEAGNLLLALSQIYAGDEQSCLAELSTYFFEDIIDHQIRTKELFNNLAIGKTIAALQYYSGDYKMVRFPFMLESKSMLYNVSSSRGANETGMNGYAEIYEEQVSGYLDEAEMNLLDAKKLDKTFYPAYINLSIIYTLKQKFGAAQDELNAAMKFMGEDHPLVWTVYEMRGIIGHLQLENELSDNLFAAAEVKGSITANYNLHALKNDFIPEAGTSVLYFSTDTTEKFNSVNMFDYLNKITVNKMGRYDLKNGKAVLFTDTLSDYTVFNIKPVPEARLSKIKLMMLHESSLISTTKNIHIGSGVADLEQAYGVQPIILLESDKMIYIYPKQNLMVWVVNGQVEKWCYWWVK